MLFQSRNGKEEPNVIPEPSSSQYVSDLLSEPERAQEHR